MIRRGDTYDVYRGDITYTIKDIEGCFPNMPKEAIEFGLLELTSQLRKEGRTEVIVPKKDSLKCSWTSRKKYGIVRMPLQTMMDVIKFVLDNTFIKDGCGCEDTEYDMVHDTQFSSAHDLDGSYYTSALQSHTSTPGFENNAKSYQLVQW